ncbi:MAG: hypothetical protein HYW96_00315 [Candidatus Wildermuthbacteria bacterium]|nr:hypothetical protein [Candidatus Wildermuthbacteria bacterium]
MFRMLYYTYPEIREKRYKGRKEMSSFTSWLTKAAIAIAVLSVGVIFVVSASSRALAGSPEENDTSIALTSDMNRSIKTGLALHFVNGSSVSEIADRKYYPGDVITAGFAQISNESPDARWAHLGISFDTHQYGLPYWIVETRGSDRSWMSGPVVVEGNSVTQVEFRVIVGNSTGGIITGPRLILNESPIPPESECPVNTQCG